VEFGSPDRKHVKFKNGFPMQRCCWCLDVEAVLLTLIKERRPAISVLADRVNRRRMLSGARRSGRRKGRGNVTGGAAR
jgi:hypothetical protein